MSERFKHLPNLQTVLGRTLLATAVLTTSLPTAKVISDPEARAGIQATFTIPQLDLTAEPNFNAWFKRSYPENKENPKLEMKQPSDEALQATWEKYFKSRGIISYEAWTAAPLHVSDPGGFGRSLSTFANLYYANEKAETEDFDSYYQRFVTQLINQAEAADLHPEVLVISLKISAENIQSLKGQRDDVFQSYFQTAGIAVTRSLGIEDRFVESLSHQGAIIKALNLRDRLQDRDYTKRPDPPSDGLPPYTLMRFPIVTIGMMDFEVEDVAAAYEYFSNEYSQSLFINQYPEIASNYAEINKSKAAIEQTRAYLYESAEQYVMNYSTTLEPFAKGDPAALDAIELGPNNLEFWQLNDFTYAWEEYTRDANDRNELKERIPQRLIREANTNPEKFYINFMGQQLHNEKFMAYIRTQAQNNSSDEQIQAIDRLQELINQYKDQVKNYSIIRLQTIGNEVSHEYNSDFQIRRSVMITNMLSKTAGPFDPNNPNSISDHTYKVIYMREVAVAPILMAGKVFARKRSVDGYYAREEMRDQLNYFNQLLLNEGLIRRPPQSDIKEYISAINNLRYKQRAAWPNITDESWNNIIDIFDNYINPRGAHLHQGQLISGLELSPLPRAQAALETLYKQ